jgi:hypothetical protein
MDEVALLTDEVAPRVPADARACQVVFLRAQAKADLALPDAVTRAVDNRRGDPKDAVALQTAPKEEADHRAHRQARPRVFRVRCS